MDYAIRARSDYIMCCHNSTDRPPAQIAGRFLIGCHNIGAMNIRVRSVDNCGEKLLKPKII